MSENASPVAPVQNIVHTPQRWHVRNDANNHWGMREVVGPALRVVGFTSGIGMTLEQSRAVERDARLIAAVPEMIGFIREVALPPYPDSDLGSLLKTLEVRAKAILEKIV